MLVNPILNKINLMFSQCVIKIVTDKNKTQTIQTELHDGEVREKVERWQEYGFTCNPPSNSEALCLFLGGERDRGFIIATENKNYRVLDLKEGEVCLYTHEKDKIYFQNENKLLIQTKEFSIEDKKHMLTAEESVAVKTKEFSIEDKKHMLTAEESIAVKTKEFSIEDKKHMLTAEESIAVKTKEFSIEDKKHMLTAEESIAVKTKEFSIEDKKHMLTAEESVAVKTKDFSLNNKNFSLQSDQKTSIQTKTFAVSNGSAELIDIISQTLEILSTTTVSTCSGPMPLKDFAKLQKLKIQIDTFKS
jgi:phage baseplate assembly protein V